MDKSQFISGVCDIYDERLLENSLTTEGNVCGCLLSDLTYYDDAGLEAKDFITKDGRMLFTIGKELRDKGLSNFDEITLLSNVNESVREKIETEFGGYRSIQNIIDVVSIKNWDGFLDTLNKRNILLSLYKKNFNLFDEMTLDNGKKVIPFKLFDKLTSSEVLDWYSSQLTTLTTKINSAKIIEEAYVDFDEAFIQKLEAQEELGVSFGEAGLNINGEEIRTFKFMSNSLRGLKHGTLSCFGAASGCGKSTYMIGTLMSLASKGEKIILISNESQVADIKVQFLVWFLTRYLDYWKVSKNKLIAGTLTDEDKEMIAKARQCYREKYAKSIKIVTLADADAHLTCQLIKKAIQREGATVFCVDTFKLSFDNNSKENFWLSLVADTRSLAEIALRYNAIGLMTIQLAINSQNRSWLDADCLSNSKAVKEVLSNLVLFRKVVPELEFDPNSPYYIKPFRSKQKEDGTWYEEPYTPDPTKTWRIFFINKARRGPDSNDTQIAYLSRFDPEHASFYETAKCRPTHKLFNTEGK